MVSVGWDWCWCSFPPDTLNTDNMNVPLKINLAVAGAVIAATLPVIGLGWTITTSHEGIGVKVSFYKGPNEFWFIIDGQIHMSHYTLRETPELEQLIDSAIANFVWDENE